MNVSPQEEFLTIQQTFPNVTEMIVIFLSRTHLKFQFDQSFLPPHTIVPKKDCLYSKDVLFNDIINRKHLSRASRFLTNLQKSTRPVIEDSRQKYSGLLHFSSSIIYFSGSMLRSTRANLFHYYSQVLPTSKCLHLKGGKTRSCCPTFA